MKKNNMIFIPIIILFIIMLIYALGFSSNLSYANKDFILSANDYPVSDFNDKIQPFNNLIFYFVIILFLILLSVYLTNGHSRTKYLTSNVVTISLLSGAMIIFSIINFVSLPGFIKEYNALLINHSVFFEESARYNNLIPSPFMYYVGLVIAFITLLYAAFLILYLVRRMKNQKAYILKRDEVLNNAKWKTTLSTK